MFKLEQKHQSGKCLIKKICKIGLYIVRIKMKQKVSAEAIVHNVY